MRRKRPRPAPRLRSRLSCRTPRLRQSSSEKRRSPVARGKACARTSRTRSPCRAGPPATPQRRRRDRRRAQSARPRRAPRAIACQRWQPGGQAVVRRDLDPKQRPTILVVHVIVAHPGPNAPVLHAPALSHDVLAGVGPHVIVDVEDGGAVVAAGRGDEACRHPGVERRATVGLLEQPPQELAHATGVGTRSARSSAGPVGVASRRTPSTTNCLIASTQITA